MEHFALKILSSPLFAVLPGADSGGNNNNAGINSNTAGSCPKQTFIIPCDSGNGGSIWNLLSTIVNFLSIGVGIAVLAGIVFGAFLYATSGGSAEQAKRGIGYIRNALIALLLFAFMYAIIQFIIPGGLF